MTRARQFGAVWGVTGILVLLMWAIYRLTPYAYEALSSQLALWQWLVMLLWAVFMLVSEGYGGFQKRLAPRVVSRARLLARSGVWYEIILAPLYCFGYIRASKRQLLVSYSAVLLIVAAVIVVHQLPQPTRGIIDSGVVVGLAYGVGAILDTAYREFLIQ